MGQAYVVCNLDKRQFLRPHKCGDGSKLTEIVLSGGGTMTCLGILLASGNGQGGGDLKSSSPIVGSWAGGRIVVAGDYMPAGKFLEGESEADLTAAAQSYAAGYRDKERVTLHAFAKTHFEDVSDKALLALADDKNIAPGLAADLKDRLPGGWASTFPMPAELLEKLAAAV